MVYLNIKKMNDLHKKSNFRKARATNNLQAVVTSLYNNYIGKKHRDMPKIIRQIEWFRLKKREITFLFNLPFTNASIYW